MKIGFSAGKLMEGCIFCADNYCNSLCKIDIEKRIMYPVNEFRGEENQTFMYLECLSYEDRIIFIPNMATSVCIYNPKENEMDMINVSRKRNNRFCFSSGYLIDDTLFLVPGNKSQNFIRINLLNNNIDILFSLDNYFSEDVDEDKQLFWKTCRYKDYILMPQLGTDNIFIFDISSFTFTHKKVDVDSIYSIYCFDNEIWICATNKRVFKWDFENDVITPILLQSLNPDISSGMILKNNENIFYVPNFGIEVLKYISGNGFKFFSNINIDNLLIDGSVVYYHTYEKCGSSSFVFPTVRGNILHVDSNHMEEIEINVKYDDRYLKKYQKAMNKTVCGIMSEGSPYLLEDYISGVLGE